MMTKYNDNYNCKELIVFGKHSSAKQVIIKFIEDRTDRDLYRGISSIENLDRKTQNNGIGVLGIIKKYICLFDNIYNDNDLKIAAQHYGGITNYLDFTYNPLIALFFAISNIKNDNDNYEVIRISREDYNESKLENKAMLSQKFNKGKNDSNNMPLKGIMSNEFTQEISALHNDGFSKKSPEENNNTTQKISSDIHHLTSISGTSAVINDTGHKTLDCNCKLNFYVPDVYTNQRIFNQQGVFCILEDDFSNKYGESISKFILKVSHVYRIPKELRNDILIELEALGIDEIHLFQDIEGLIDHAKIKSSLLKPMEK